MKKFITMAVVGLLVIAFAISIVSAAPDTTPTTGRNFGKQITLTPEQKEELAPLYKQMLETKKQILQKYVGYGYITQEQAQQRIERMENNLKDGNFKAHIGMGRLGNHQGKEPGNGQGFRHHQQCPQQPQQ